MTETRLGDSAALPYVLVFILLALGTGFLIWSELTRSRSAVDRGTPGEASSPSGAIGDRPGAGGAVDEAPSPAPARLAVLPFVDPDAEDAGVLNRELSEAFVAALVRAAPEDIVVVGPTTTSQHVRPQVSLAEIAAAVDADYVLHGGHRAASGVFFVEVVLPDGGHLFAQRFEPLTGTPAEVAAEVVPALTASILTQAGRAPR